MKVESKKLYHPPGKSVLLLSLTLELMEDDVGLRGGEYVSVIYDKGRVIITRDVGDVLTYKEGIGIETVLIGGGTE